MGSFHAGLSKSLWGALLALFAATSVHGAACTAADTEVLAWLDRMSRSLENLSYHGTATLQRGGDVQVLRVYHLVEGDNSSERLVQLTGQGAQVEREAHALTCLHPGQRMLRLAQSQDEDPCGIARYYRVSLGAEERVAGRNALELRVQPGDMYRFGYRMALDRETGLLLKAQTLDNADRVLETFQFADLAYARADRGQEAPSVVHRARHPGSAAGTAEAPLLPRAWIVRWLPAGFRATDAAPERSARRTFTDGLAVFSIFLEQPANTMLPGEGVVRQGGTISYTRGMQLDGQPVLVTVLGEVPVNTARMVADSIAWVQ